MQRLDDRPRRARPRRPPRAARGGADHDDDLAPRCARRGVLRGERVERAATDLLVQLGQFARHRRGPRAEFEREVGERLREPARRFVEDQRARHGGQRVDPLAARRAPRRQEALEEEPVGRQARDAQRRERRRRRPARRSTGEPRRRPPRRPACSRDRKSAACRRRKSAPAPGPRPSARKRPRARLGGVVLVIGRRAASPIAVTGEQGARDARVLGEHRVGRRQDGERAQRHVARDCRSASRRHRGRARARADSPRAVDEKAPLGAAPPPVFEGGAVVMSAAPFCRSIPPRQRSCASERRIANRRLKMP